MTDARVALLSDDALVVEYDAQSEPLVKSWLPRTSRVADGRAQPRGVISVQSADAGRASRPASAGLAVLSLGGVSVSALPGEAFALGASSGVRADIALGELRAGIVAPRQSDAIASGHVSAALTLCSALLLNRIGGALMHAGAVVDERGGAWLVAGDSHSGKTTTCVSLVMSGWRYLSDDQVVVRPTTREIMVEGWPRVAHVDSGWRFREITGARVDFDIDAMWPERLVRSAPLRGLLLTSINGGAPTSLSASRPGDALAAMVRQSPWLMADSVAAPAVLQMLNAAALMPSYAVSLGEDTFGHGDAFRRVVDRVSAQG